jgi:uncharacterized protein (TIGR02266 family)
MMQGQSATQILPVTPANRRVANRVDVELEITVNSESNFFTGFSENISEGGLFVATYNHKQRGEKVDIELDLPDGGDTIKIQCIVRWTREYNQMCPDMVPGMGLQFIGLTPLEEDRITHFVRTERDPMFVDMD